MSDGDFLGRGDCVPGARGGLQEAFLLAARKDIFAMHPVVEPGYSAKMQASGGETRASVLLLWERAWNSR